MNFKKYAKVFSLYKGNKHKAFISFDVPERETYYDFLSKKKDEGYRQFIISGEYMRKLIAYFIAEEDFLLIEAEVENIEESDLRIIIEQIQKNPVYLFKLFTDECGEDSEIRSVVLKKNKDILEINSAGFVSKDMAEKACSVLGEIYNGNY